jgi:hypothetical protein
MHRAWSIEVSGQFMSDEGKIRSRDSDQVVERTYALLIEFDGLTRCVRVAVRLIEMRARRHGKTGNVAV